MHGKGTFFDPRLDDATQFPIAARERLRSRARGRGPDHAAAAGASALPARAAGARRRRAAASTAQAAKRGEAIFMARPSARPATCRRSSPSPAGTCIPRAEIGIDDFQAGRARRMSATARRRSRGLWTHTKGGFYHDGRFATLAAVIDHYDSHFSLGLSPVKSVTLPST